MHQTKSWRRHSWIPCRLFSFICIAFLQDESDSSNSSATRLYVCASDQILATSAAGTGLVTALSIMQLRRLSC